MGFTTLPHKQGMTELVRNYRQRKTRLRSRQNRIVAQSRLLSDLNALENTLLYTRQAAGLVEALRWESEVLTERRYDPQGIGWVQDYARVRKIIGDYLTAIDWDKATPAEKSFFDDGKLIRVRASRMRSRVAAAHGIHLSDTAWATFHYVMGGYSQKDPAANGYEQVHGGRQELIDAGLITEELPVDEGIVAPFVDGRPVMATGLARMIFREYHNWIGASLRPRLER